MFLFGFKELGKFKNPIKNSIVEKIAYYCQKCRAANESGEGNCWRCGTRLMLVVFPPSLKHEDGLTPSFYEDHLLERVSLLELRLVQVMEQLKMAYEFLQRETSTLQKDHLFLQAFFETIEKVNPDFADSLNREFFELYNEKTESLEKKEKPDEELDNILSSHIGKQLDLFEHLVREGVGLFKENEEKQAFRTLEKAELLSPENVPLLRFIGKQFFLAENYKNSLEYFQKVQGIDHQDLESNLFLGFILADEGNCENSRKYLSLLVNKPETSFCANLIWGFMAMLENNWLEGLAAFKEAEKIKSLPEINYLIGCVNFQLQNYEKALNNLDKTLELDPDFADAWFMRSLIFEIIGKNDRAKNSLKKAFEIKEAGADCLEFLKHKESPVLRTSLPFRHLNNLKSGFLTKGSHRMRKFFRNQIFDSLNK